MKRDREFELKGKSVAKIVSEHLLTLFNFINLALAAALLAAGSYKNLLFIGTVLCNFAIGVFWEIRAKLTLEKCRLITQSTVTVERHGRREEISRRGLITGDRVILGSGVGVVCDGPLLSGRLKADESSLTGESEPVEKNPGDTLLSGTVVISGSGVMCAERIGRDCYAAKIVRSLKGEGGKKSVMMRALHRIIFYLSLVILPLGALMFWRQWDAAGELSAAVIGTAAALVGMIPDGLMLLTTTVLAIGVVRLAQKKVLVQQLYSIESLARTDVICLDKTGTLTTGEMSVEELVPFSEDFVPLLERFCAASRDGGATLQALRRHFSPEPLEADAFLPFDSARKFSALRLGEESLVLGAGELLGGLTEEQAELLSRQSKNGRTLVLYRGDFDETKERLNQTPCPLGMVRLSDTLREGIGEALAFFDSQSVQIKVLSGDSLETVKRIAADCGVKNAHLAVDCSAVSQEALRRAALEQTVFARVTPEGKKLLVEALQAAGHTVAMTGDGVNDVPAMRVSDCAVAPVSGTDAAKNAASLVMMDDDFCSLPYVVARGRQSIGNVERSSGVFLTKTVFSALLTLFFLLWCRAYPFQPIQLTLISTTGIGIPSFLLGLEPSRDRIRGNFLKKVLRFCVPGGTAAALCVVGATLLSDAGVLSAEALPGVCVLTSYLCVYSVLLSVMHPLNAYRAAIAVGSPVLFFGGFFLLGFLFEVRPLSVGALGVALGLFVPLAALVFGLQHCLGGNNRD